MKVSEIKKFWIDNPDLTIDKIYSEDFKYITDGLNYIEISDKDEIVANDRTNCIAIRKYNNVFTINCDSVTEITYRKKGR